MSEKKLKGRLLIVDDEDNILTLFKRDFFRTGIEIFMANNYEEAVKIVKAEEIDVIISDLKMDKIDGIETLRKMKQDFPDIHRILLSGIVEKPEVIKAITNGTASAFIAKPWDRDILLDRIEHILQTREIIRNRHLLDVIKTINSLPVLPKIYSEFMEAYNKDASIKEISEILHNDASLTIEVLRVANSAYYSSIQISDLKQAILHLGLKYVKDIVFTVSIVNALKWNRLQVIELQGIFNHSIKVNRFLSHYFQLKYNTPVSNEYSSAGVLHDIGKIILLQYFPGRYFQIMQYMKTNKQTDWYNTELKLGYEGCTHTEIGAFFLNHWNFPEVNVEMSLHHHQPQNASGYLRKFMYGLRYINEFVSICDSSKSITIDDFREFKYDDLSQDQVEKLFTDIMEKI
ncbi:MAG: HDOD domain-containing protein [Candidatus Marinimicrobia bacterium]|nr:HDOD domain-containing protein [Candidatus Neomarinimicrobiota bacterium]